MTEKKRLARIALDNAADAIALEDWVGKWEDDAPVGKQLAVAHELERRCPGHSLEEYLTAIAYAFKRKMY
jgi:hypothetical protein